MKSYTQRVLSLALLISIPCSMRGMDDALGNSSSSSSSIVSTGNNNNNNMPDLENEDLLKQEDMPSEEWLLQHGIQIHNPIKYQVADFNGFELNDQDFTQLYAMLNPTSAPAPVASSMPAPTPSPSSPTNVLTKLTPSPSTISVVGGIATTIGYTLQNGVVSSAVTRNILRGSTKMPLGVALTEVTVDVLKEFALPAVIIAFFAGAYKEIRDKVKLEDANKKLTKDNKDLKLCVQGLTKSLKHSSDDNHALLVNEYKDAMKTCAILTKLIEGIAKNQYKTPNDVSTVLKDKVLSRMTSTIAVLQKELDKNTTPADKKPTLLEWLQSKLSFNKNT